MVPEKNEISLEEQKLSKKPYRKPTVQMYGTLASTTKSAANPHTGTVDNFHNPGWVPAART